MTELRDSVRLLIELKANNSREWYQLHKTEIEAGLLNPGQQATTELQSLLEESLEVGLQHKIYRLNRDLRFSKDKTPYQTHFRFSIWPDFAEQENSVCFHFSVETDRLVCGVGLWEFGSRLDNFRVRCGELESLLIPEMRLSEPELKRVPAGLTPSLELSDHFRRKGLTVWIDSPAAEGDSAQFQPKNVLSLVPAYRWLCSLSD